MNDLPKLDHASSTPIYRQVTDWIVERISTGEWPEGHQLPAEPALAAALGVSRGTLRKTIAGLVEHNVLVQVQGKGTFVAKSLIDQPLASTLTSVSEQFIRSGTPFTTVVLAQRVQAADARTAKALSLSDGAPTVYLERVRSVDGYPVVISESFLPAERFVNLVDIDFRQRRLYEVLEDDNGVELERAHRTISAITASSGVAKVLDAPAASPILYSEQTVFERDGRAVEYSRAWFRGDRFRLSSETIRRDGEPVHAVSFPSDWTMQQSAQ